MYILSRHRCHVISGESERTVGETREWIHDDDDDDDDDDDYEGDDDEYLPGFHSLTAGHSHPVQTPSYQAVSPCQSNS